MMKYLRALLKKLLFKVAPEFSHRIFLYKFKKTILPAQFSEHLKKLNSAHTVIDLGANVGLVSECMALTGATVIAFEPGEVAYAKLSEVASKFPNLKTYKQAAGTENRINRLYLHGETSTSNQDLSQSSSLMENKPNVSSELFEEVQEVDFANFLRTLDSEVELIKIDIEGFEIELVNYLIDEKVLNKVCKIYLETHEHTFPELEAGTDILRKRINEEGLGYKFFFDWH